MLRKSVMTALLCVGLGSTGGAQAASVSYYLNQSNVDAALADGVNYLKVKIDNDVAGWVRFTVDVLSPLTSIAGSNFGIQDFGFNVKPGSALPPDSAPNPSAWVLPTGWASNTAPPPNAADGFGKFDVQPSTTGSNRPTSLQFSFQSTNALTSFLDLSNDSGTSGNAIQGNSYFAAHVAGFNAPGGVTSGYFGATSLVPAPVPVPAPLVLLASALVPLFRMRSRKK